MPEFSESFPQPLPAILRQGLEAIPSMLLVVDGDVRIQYLNAAASEGLGLDRGAQQRRAGEALNCRHSQEDPSGCGHAPACRSCAVRGAVNLVQAGGKIQRKAMCLELVHGDRILECHLQVSAGPLWWADQDLVLLTLEDTDELLRLRGLMPLCGHCRQPRTDPDYLREIETYLDRYPGIETSRGLCPGCQERLAPPEP